MAPLAPSKPHAVENDHKRKPQYNEDNLASEQIASTTVEEDFVLVTKTPTPPPSNTTGPTDPTIRCKNEDGGGQTKPFSAATAVAGKQLPILIAKMVAPPTAENLPRHNLNQHAAVVAWWCESSARLPFVDAAGGYSPPPPAGSDVVETQDDTAAADGPASSTHISSEGRASEALSEHPSSDVVVGAGAKFENMACQFNTYAEVISLDGEEPLSLEDNDGPAAAAAAAAAAASASAFPTGADAPKIKRGPHGGGGAHGGAIKKKM